MSSNEEYFCNETYYMQALASGFNPDPEDYGISEEYALSIKSNLDIKDMKYVVGLTINRRSRRKSKHVS